jgi:(+)-pinoresinol hydroxylase
VKQKDFNEALRQFEEAVGREWIFSSPEDMNLYRDSYSPFWRESGDPVPSAAVAPDRIEQVQTVVRIANTDKIHEDEDLAVPGTGGVFYRNSGCA